MRYSPWLHLRSRPDITLEIAALEDADGWWDAGALTITIDRTLSRAGRRCALAHELVHAERGDEPCCTPELEARQEAVVEREAARRLIEIDELAAIAIAYSPDPWRVAEELDVDLPTLMARVAALTPDEGEFLRRRLAEKEHAA